MSKINPLPRVQLIYRDDLGLLQQKYLLWRRPCTNQALAEFLDDYLEMVREGYLPVGFVNPPLLICARVHLLGRVLAEWHNVSYDIPGRRIADEQGARGRRAGSREVLPATEPTNLRGS